MLEATYAQTATVGGDHAQSSTDLSGAQVLRHVHPRPEMLARSIDTHVHACSHTQTHAHMHRGIRRNKVTMKIM